MLKRCPPTPAYRIGLVACKIVGSTAALDGGSGLAVLDGAAASSVVDSAATAASGGLGEALAGAGSELVSDAAAVVGDAASAVGSAVTDAAVGVATDAALGTGTVWGVWDGMQRIVPPWLFTSGTVVVAGELAFAAFAFSVAQTAMKENDSFAIAIFF